MQTITVPKGGRRKSVAHHARRASLFADFAGTFSRRGPAAPREGAWWRGKKQKNLANPPFAVIINGAFCCEPTPARRAKKVSSCARQLVSFSV
jgi:hypothetical protein